MNSFIDNLESRLKEQLESLAKQITLTEENLLRSKEGFLKVQGALEVIAVLKAETKTDVKEEEEKEEKQSE